MPTWLFHFSDFNPRSREGSDISQAQLLQDWRISIHAPAKGATYIFLTAVVLLYHFNPRSREGSDSSHSRFSTGFSIFQSTLPRRERPGVVFSSHGDMVFQSTLPRRERPFGAAFSISRADFNPRSREGSDVDVRRCREYRADFNPRSREGSDHTRIMEYGGICKFQSTLPRRERRLPDGPSEGGAQISIHAPAKGATIAAITWLCWRTFQSTLPRRERLITGLSPVTELYFNPRSREGSDEKRLCRFIHRL